MTTLRIFCAAALACALTMMAFTTAAQANPVLKQKPKEAVAIDVPGARPSVEHSAGTPSDEVSARRGSHRRHHAPSNLITISTAGGGITVAASHADKFRGLIADLVARGYSGPIKCYARGGHVRGSLHYRGEACDFAQRGWNRTHRLMYRVADLAAKWGLRDGCSFRDCGHIDTGARLARGPGRRLVAEVPRPVWPVVLH